MEEYHRLCKKVDENVVVETEEKGLRFQAFFRAFFGLSSVRVETCLEKLAKFGAATLRCYRNRRSLSSYNATLCSILCSTM